MAVRTLVPNITVVSDINQPIIQNARSIDLDKSFKFNWGDGDLELTGGNIVFVSEIENLKQWIAKTLATPQQYNVTYNDHYGNMAIELFGSSESIEILEIMLPELIKQALINDDRILNIDRFVITRSNDNITATFRVQTINYDFFNYENSWVIT